MKENDSRLQIIPSKIDFGNVYEKVREPGVPEVYPNGAVTLINRGGEDVTVGKVTVSDTRFRTVFAPVLVPANSSLQILVYYTPAERDHGPHKAKLVLGTEAVPGGSVEVELQGEFVFFP